MWSEFGRRPEENGSLGTDHGAAGCAFVIGSKAKGEMVGEFPGLATLDDNDNLRVTSDFRGDVLLAAGAVAGPRRGLGHPRRLRLRAADPGEGVRQGGRGARSAWRWPALTAVAIAIAGRRRAPPRPAGRLRLAAALQAGRQARQAPRHGSAGSGASSTGGPATPAGAAATGRARRRRRRRPAAAGRRTGTAHSATSASKPSSGATPSPAPKSTAGEVIVELNNQGEDTHNLNLQREGSEDPALESRRSRPGERPRRATSTCAAGEYRLYCSLAPAEEHGALVVTPDH